MEKKERNQGEKFLQNFVSSRDGPVNTETCSDENVQEDYHTMEQWR